MDPFHDLVFLARGRRSLLAGRVVFLTLILAGIFRSCWGPFPQGRGETLKESRYFCLRVRIGDGVSSFKDDDVWYLGHWNFRGVSGDLVEDRDERHLYKGECDRCFFSSMIIC